VNGKTREVDAARDTPLLYVLRNDLGLNGPKYGCGLGEYGTCTVLIDGKAARSCVISIQVCGYCLNGMNMTMKALLNINPHPSEPEIAQALQYNLCRCGAHVEIMRAAVRAAGQTAEVGD